MVSNLPPSPGLLGRTNQQAAASGFYANEYQRASRRHEALCVFFFLFFLPGGVGHSEITFCESCNESQEEAERQVDLPSRILCF